jgi:hypothetical protein
MCPTKFVHPPDLHVHQGLVSVVYKWNLSDNDKPNTSVQGQ